MRGFPPYIIPFLYFHWNLLNLGSIAVTKLNNALELIHQGSDWLQT